MLFHFMCYALLLMLSSGIPAVVESRSYNTGLIFYDLDTKQILLPPTVSVSRGRALANFKFSAKGSIWSTFGKPCDCSGPLCGCCVGIKVKQYNFDEKMCANVSYIKPKEEVNLEVYLNEAQSGKYGISARNPSPLCVPIMMPIPMSMCVQMSNVGLQGNNLNMCMDFVMRLESTQLFEMHFQCMKMGADGVQWVNPGGAPVIPPGESKIKRGSNEQDSQEYYDENAIEKEEEEAEEAQEGEEENVEREEEDNKNEINEEENKNDNAIEEEEEELSDKEAVEENINDIFTADQVDTAQDVEEYENKAEEILDNDLKDFAMPMGEQTFEGEQTKENAMDFNGGEEEMEEFPHKDLSIFDNDMPQEVANDSLFVKPVSDDPVVKEISKEMENSPEETNESYAAIQSITFASEETMAAEKQLNVTTLIDNSKPAATAAAAALFTAIIPTAATMALANGNDIDNIDNIATIATITSTTMATIKDPTTTIRDALPISLTLAATTTSTVAANAGGASAAAALSLNDEESYNSDNSQDNDSDYEDEESDEDGVKQQHQAEEEEEEEQEKQEVLEDNTDEKKNKNMLTESESLKEIPMKSDASHNNNMTDNESLFKENEIESLEKGHYEKDNNDGEDDDDDDEDDDEDEDNEDEDDTEEDSDEFATEFIPNKDKDVPQLQRNSSSTASSKMPAAVSLASSSTSAEAEEIIKKTEVKNKLEENLINITSNHFQLTTATVTKITDDCDNVKATMNNNNDSSNISTTTITKNNNNDNQSASNVSTPLNSSSTTDADAGGDSKDQLKLSQITDTATPLTSARRYLMESQRLSPRQQEQRRRQQKQQQQQKEQHNKWQYPLHQQYQVQHSNLLQHLNQNHIQPRQQRNQQRRFYYGS